MTQSRNSALIVGASRGLGLGLVETFLKRGWRVTATQRAPSPELARLDSDALRVETADIDDDAGVAERGGEGLDEAVDGARVPGHGGDFIHFRMFINF